MLDLTGLFAPLVTPFTDDGSTISEVRLARLVRHLSGHEISGYVCGAETGEFYALSLSERKSLLELTLREAQGRPVLAHVTANATAAALDLAQHASRHGARAAVLMPPYAGHLLEGEMVAMVETMASFANLAIVVVDPAGRLTAADREQLRAYSQVMIAEPIHAEAGFGADEFRLDAMICTPLALIRQHGDLTQLQAMLDANGGARLGKAALEAAGIEVGPLRAPFRALDREGRAALASLAPD